MRSSSPAAWVGTAGIWVSLSALLLSGVVVVWHLGFASLTEGVAHESAGRSLPGIALYPNHALREMPHILLFALCWIGGLVPPADGRAAARTAVRIVAALAGCGLLLFLWAAIETDAATALRDLSQSRAAADLREAGVHFRYHLLSDVALGALFYLAGRIASRSGSARGARLPALAGVLLLAMALVWGVGETASTRFLGHQAREVATFPVVIVPLLLAFGIRRTGRFEPRAALRPDGLVAAAVFLVVGAGIAAAFLAADLSDLPALHARPIPLNLSAHAFEHLLDLACLTTVTWWVTRHGDRGATDYSPAE